MEYFLSSKTLSVHVNLDLNVGFTIYELCDFMQHFTPLNIPRLQFSLLQMGVIILSTNSFFIPDSLI